MTRDLAILINPDHPWFTTNQFLDKLDANLRRAMGLSNPALLLTAERPGTGPGSPPAHLW